MKKIPAITLENLKQLSNDSLTVREHKALCAKVDDRIGYIWRRIHEMAGKKSLTKRGYDYDFMNAEFDGMAGPYGLNCDQYGEFDHNKRIAHVATFANLKLSDDVLVYNLLCHDEWPSFDEDELITKEKDAIWAVAHGDASDDGRIFHISVKYLVSEDWEKDFMAKVKALLAKHKAEIDKCREMESASKKRANLRKDALKKAKSSLTDDELEALGIKG